MNGYYLFFDCETTGLFINYEPLPRLVQLSWRLYDVEGGLIEQSTYIVKPEGFEIPEEATAIHGITTKEAIEKGKMIEEVLSLFGVVFRKSTCLVGHNIDYDLKILSVEKGIWEDITSLNREKGVRVEKIIKDDIYLKAGYMVKKIRDTYFLRHRYVYDTMKELTGYVGALKSNGYLKPPKLTELYEKVFGKEFSYAHNAEFDVKATADCFFKLLEDGVIIKKGFVFLIETEIQRGIQERKVLRSKTRKKKGSTERLTEQMKKEKPLKDHRFVISGKFLNYSREDMKACVKCLGGRLQALPSKKTDYIIAGEHMGWRKKERADELNTPVLSEEEFENYCAMMCST